MTKQTKSRSEGKDQEQTLDQLKPLMFLLLISWAAGIRGQCMLCKL